MDLKQDLEKLMKAANEMQENMQKAQEELNRLTVTGKSGGGMVEITMNCRHDVLKVKIEPSVKEEPVEILQDVIMAAMNDAIRKVEKISKQKVNELAAGFNFSKDLMDAKADKGDMGSDKDN